VATDAVKARSHNGKRSSVACMTQTSGFGWSQGFASRNCPPGRQNPATSPWPTPSHPRHDRWRRRPGLQVPDMDHPRLPGDDGRRGWCGGLLGFVLTVKNGLNLSLLF